jgi:hypothetical protein
MIPWLGIGLLLTGLLLAWLAPRLGASRLWRVYGLWWPPRPLSRTGQRLVTVHLLFVAVILVAAGLSQFVPSQLAQAFTLIATISFLVNLAVGMLVTTPLLILGVATIRPPKDAQREPPALR